VALGIAMGVAVMVAVHGDWRRLQLLVEVRIAPGIPGRVVRAQATAAWTIRRVVFMWFRVRCVDGFVSSVVFFQFPISYNIKNRSTEIIIELKQPKWCGIWRWCMGSKRVKR